jgi:hypothetical protein
MGPEAKLHSVRFYYELVRGLSTAFHEKALGCLVERLCTSVGHNRYAPTNNETGETDILLFMLRRLTDRRLPIRALLIANAVLAFLVSGICPLSRR